MNVHIEIYLMRYHVGSCVNASVIDGQLRLSNNYDLMNNTDITFFSNRDKIAMPLICMPITSIIG